jgi:hypothetical protein
VRNRPRAQPPTAVALLRAPPVVRRARPPPIVGSILSLSSGA